MSNRAMLMRRYEKPWTLWWPKDSRKYRKIRDHVIASGAAWDYSHGHAQLIHNGRKP